MRVLGILGGMSWESTLVYYRLLNQGVAARLGGLHSAPLLMASVDFDGIAAAQRAGDWAGAGAALGALAVKLHGAGAQGLLIASNTMHKVAGLVTEAAPGLPLLHIGDATGRALRAAGHTRVGLLGTRFTMEDRFLRDHLGQAHGVDTLVPEAAGRDEVHRVIYDELCRGQVMPASRQRYLAIMQGLADRGCEAIILGCTEIALLTPPDLPPTPNGWPTPLFDTTAMHAHEAVQWMLDPEKEAP
ncbi:MAG: aspartate/glutamate racemase family protein [Pseudomonadota bacterium]